MKKLIAVICALVFMTPVASQAQVVLRVGTTATALPLAGLDPQTRSIGGLAPDVMRAVAKDAGLQIIFEPMVVADLLPALTAGKIDVVAGGIVKTPTREAVADFSQAFASFGDGVLVPVADDTPYKSMSDFSKLKMVAPKGSLDIDALTRAGAGVTLVDTAPQLVEDVENGIAAGALCPVPIALYLLKDDAHPKVKLVATYTPIVYVDVALVVHKGDAKLLDTIDASLKKLRADGSIKAIALKWGFTPK